MPGPYIGVLFGAAIKVIDPGIGDQVRCVVIVQCG